MPEGGPLWRLGVPHGYRWIDDQTERGQPLSSGRARSEVQLNMPLDLLRFVPTRGLERKV